eukprot:Skav221538  [mRNA]  locus=scaffold1813:129776:131420:+ [translate_table: standard]
MGSSASIWKRRGERGDGGEPGKQKTALTVAKISCNQVQKVQNRYADFVVATSDFDPNDIHWPHAWGVALPLKKSMAIRIISDDGGDRAFGHYVGQPEQRGYFLKHLTEALCPAPLAPLAPLAPDPQKLHFQHLESSGAALQPESQHGLHFESKGIPGEGTPSTSSPSPTWTSSPFSRASSPVPPTSPQLLSAAMPRSHLYQPKLASRSSQNQSAFKDLKATAATAATAKASHFNSPRSSKCKDCTDLETIEASASSGLERCHSKGERSAALGLDLETDHLQWLDEAAASAKLPEGWITFDDDEGRAVYYQEKRRYVTRKHPMLQRFKAYAEQVQKFYQGQSTVPNSAKIRAHLAVLLNEVLNRCHRELPPVTPVLLERAALLLGIDTASEFALSTKVKIAIESFAEDQYDIAVATHQKADVDSFMKLLRAEQIQAVISKGETIIMCSEFDELPATLKCEDTSAI